jgi:serine/threonine protein kinase
MTLVGSGSYGRVFRDSDNPLYVWKEMYLTESAATIPEPEHTTLCELLTLQLLRGHPNIVSYSGYSIPEKTKKGRIFVRLESCGITLKQWLHKNPSHSERVQVFPSFFVQMTSAAVHMYRHGIHHCDLNLQNVLWSNNGGAEKFTVIDLGLCSYRTVHGWTTAIGTWRLLPPEFFQTGRAHEASWVWSLLALALQMLFLEEPVQMSGLDQETTSFNTEDEKIAIRKLWTSGESAQSALSSNLRLLLTAVKAPWAYQLLHWANRCLCIDPSHRMSLEDLWEEVSLFWYQESRPLVRITPSKVMYAPYVWDPEYIVQRCMQAADMKGAVPASLEAMVSYLWDYRPNVPILRILLKEQAMRSKRALTPQEIKQSFVDVFDWLLFFMRMIDT